LEHHLDLAAHLLRKEIKRDVRSVGERLVMSGDKFHQYFIECAAADAQLVVIEPERLRDAARLR
jgi:hypothetical protein